MTEKTEWEVVDEPGRKQRDWTLWQLMQALLGKRWQWKLAAFTVAAGTALLLLAVVSFVTIAIALTTAGLFFVFNKLKSSFFKAGGYSQKRDLTL
jgi:hypothetical protein